MYKTVDGSGRALQLFRCLPGPASRPCGTASRGAPAPWQPVEAVTF